MKLQSRTTTRRLALPGALLALLLLAACQAAGPVAAVPTDTPATRAPGGPGTTRAATAAPAATLPPTARAATATPEAALSPTVQAATPATLPQAGATALPTPTATISPTRAPGVDAGPLEGQALVRALQRGGYVLYFRHSLTDWSQNDHTGAGEWWTSCDPQQMRQLSAEGRAQAAATGDSIRGLDIPVGRVLASPYCRTVETAELMDLGPVEATTDLINMGAATVVGGRERIVVTARQQLSTPPAAGTNTVAVAHGNVLQGAAGIQLAEGEAAVFAPGGDGRFTLVGRILPDAWAALAAGNEAAPATAAPAGAAGGPASCEPTPPDQLGPFYVPNAPERTSVGQGHVLTGVVRSGVDCRPIPGARIEFWMANPQGDYDDAHRATMYADQAGAYRFESNVPVPYGPRPPHIHIRVTAPGYALLVTQYYPVAGLTSGTFDLVLTPEG